MRVVVTGGTGFIGVRLVSRLKEKGYDVDVLSRRARPGRLAQNVRIVPWAEGTSWESAVDGAEGIVNLAGENVARRWTAPAKELILKSRIDSISKLSVAISRAARKPAVVVNASAVGYYGARGDEELSEEAAPGDGFLARTCVAWEGAARAFESLGLRVVRIRIGVVLAAEGGALAKMLPVFRAFVGGPIGGGGQWMSWIHRDDLVELIVFALENPLVDGVLNGTAPNPVSNRDFATALGKALRRPAMVPTPAEAVKLLMGEMATVILDGQRVVPKRALDLGFRFRFPDLGLALRDALGT